MMYLLFKYKNYDPEVYALADIGKRQVLRAFLQEEIEEMQEEK